MARLTRTSGVSLATAALVALACVLATMVSSSSPLSDSASALRLAELERSLSDPVSLVELTQTQLGAIDPQQIIQERIRPEHHQEAQVALLEANAFQGMREADQRAAVAASIEEVEAAEREGRPINAAASMLLQTTSKAVSTRDYWSNAWNRRWWCNAVRWGHWWIERHPHWQNVCKGIERFRPWGWWSTFCHNIHSGAWGRWYRHNHWWRRQCRSIRNPHFVGTSKAWVWHPQHKRHQHSTWCETHGHKYRDLNNGHYNHWCHGREAPAGYRRGFWDVDPKASAAEQENFWWCKAYKGYDRSWKLNNNFAAYQQKCKSGEGARGARHPGFNPRLTRAQRRAIRKAAKRAARRAAKRAARPQWRWSKRVARTAHSDWCEQNGLTATSSRRYQRHCEGNRESDKARRRRIKRAVRKARRRVLSRIPHRHHVRRGGRKSRRARRAARKARHAARKARRAAKKAAAKAARKAAHEKKMAERRARWAKLQEDERRAAQERYRVAHAARVARRKARAAKKHAARHARRAARRAARKARRAKRAARRQRRIAAGKPARRSRRGRKCAGRKLRKITRKFGRAYATKWQQACKAKKARRRSRIAKKRKVKQIKIARFLKSPLAVKAKQQQKLAKLKAKLSPRKRRKIARKVAKLQRKLAKNLPKGVKPNHMASILKALKLAAVVPSKKTQRLALKAKKGLAKPVPMPPAPKLPPRPATAPKTSTLKKVEKTLAKAAIAAVVPKRSAPKVPGAPKSDDSDDDDDDESSGSSSSAKKPAASKPAASQPAAPSSSKQSAPAPQQPQAPASQPQAPAQQSRSSQSDQEQQAPRRHARDERDSRFDEPKGFKMHIPEIPDAPKEAPAAVASGPAKPSIEEIWAKEDAARRLARQKRLEKEDAEDRAEEKRIRNRKRLAALRAQKASADAKTPAARRFAKGEDKDWDAKFPSEGPYEAPAKPFQAPYAKQGSAGCPGCKNRHLRKKWDIVLDPTSVAEIDRPLIEELHRRVDYLIDPVKKTMNLQQALLDSAAKQVVDAEEHHIRVYDFGEKHKNQLLIPQEIQDEQEIVDLADH